VLFVGGEPATLERVRPVLEAISKEINYLGGTGAGTTWKLINNMVVAVQIAAASEALALAEKAGFDRKAIAALIAGGGLGSPLVKMKMPRMSELEFDDPDFALRHMIKDLRYAAKMSAALGVGPDLAAAAASYYGRAEAEGRGDQDFAVVLESLRR
jgi:3-hydroxyisobutyrate dehydrogenase